MSLSGERPSYGMPGEGEDGTEAPSPEYDKQPVRYEVIYNSYGDRVELTAEPDQGWAEVTIEPIGGKNKGREVTVDAGGNVRVKGEGIYDITIEGGGEVQMSIHVEPQDEGGKRAVIDTSDTQVIVNDEGDVEVGVFQPGWDGVRLVIRDGQVSFEFFDPDTRRWVPVSVKPEDMMLLAELRGERTPGTSRIRQALRETVYYEEV